MNKLLKRVKPTVIICVRGGIADVALRPKGTRVIIRDYDQDGTPESETKKDRDGDRYWEGVWD